MASLTLSSFFAGHPKWQARRWRHLLLGLGCALVILLLLFSYWQASASLQALGNLQAQSERIGRLDSLLIQLADAESSVRGYLLSRNRAYLQPYNASLATIGYTLEDIRRDLAPSGENDAALADLSGLVALKLKILAEAVERGRVGDEAPRGRPGAEGKRYMDRIRDTLAGLKARQLAEAQMSFERSIRHFERSRWVVVALAAASLLLVLVLYLVLQRQLQLREQIAELLQGENRRLDALVQARTAELSDLASHLTNAREAETARLARELHDELGALLTAVKMDAAWLVRKLDPQALAPFRERFERLLQTLDSGIALKRRLIDDLRPPLLQELGLVAALRVLGEDFQRGSELRVELELPDEDIELPRDRALALYRIAQEGLTNIRKHAQARRVQLGLRLQGPEIRLWLVDDGCGFDPDLTSKRRHGLAGMRHRVQMFSGDFELASRVGEGTRIVARIPAAAAPAGAEALPAQ
jgi:signal transduction histidine kinase